MEKYIWKILNNSTVKTASTLLETIALNRDIKDIPGFIKPLPPHEFIKNDEHFLKLVNDSVKPAVKRIKKAAKENRPIIIHGDYDVDGQSGAAILWRTIHNDLNYKNVTPYIPNRFSEGYGLSSESIAGMLKTIKGQERPLLITVDCGIVSVDEVEEAKNAGFEVILTDHHQPSTVHPQPDQLVWTNRATGAGIAWILSYYLRDETEVSKYLDLAALGTICDLQPLTGFNRSVAKHGLKWLNKDPSAGITAIKNIAALTKPIGTYELGWVIGPRLNASGRLESAMDSVRLLATDSMQQAATIAKNLSEINAQRQDQTQSGLLLASKNYKPNPDSAFIVSAHKNYHEGIIGLIAGRLTQTYYKPSVVIAVDEEKGIAKGSARSIEGISIIEVLRRFQNLFINVGGHEMAAGFSIKPENIAKLEGALENLNEWGGEVFKKTLSIEAVIDHTLISEEAYLTLTDLEPFGTSNNQPVLATRNLTLFNYQTFGKQNDHLKLFLKTEAGQNFTALAFGQAKYAKDLTAGGKKVPPTCRGVLTPEGSKIDAAYTLSLNEWNGNRSIELILKDFRISA